MKTILCVIGLFIGAGMIGLAVNDKVTQAWEVLTGSPITQGA